MYDIISLDSKELSEIRVIAKQFNIPKVDKLEKQDLIYKILDHQALNPTPEILSKEKQDQVKPFRGRPRKDQDAKPQEPREPLPLREPKEQRPNLPVAEQKEQPKTEQPLPREQRPPRDQRPPRAPLPPREQRNPREQKNPRENKPLRPYQQKLPAETLVQM